MTVPEKNRLDMSGASVPRAFRPLIVIEQQQQKDLLWAATAPEVQQHQGRLVVVHKKRVIAVGSDRRALLHQAATQEQCSWSESVVEVVPPDGLWEPPR
jgi:hypothetical protein